MKKKLSRASYRKSSLFIQKNHCNFQKFSHVRAMSQTKKLDWDKVLQQLEESGQGDQLENNGLTNLLDIRGKVTLPVDFKFEIDCGEVALKTDEPVETNKETKKVNRKLACKFNLEQARNKKRQEQLEKLTSGGKSKLSKFVRESSSDSDIDSNYTSEEIESLESLKTQSFYNTRIQKQKFTPKIPVKIIKQDINTHKNLIPQQDFTTEACRKRFLESTSLISTQLKEQEEKRKIGKPGPATEEILKVDFDKILESLPKGENFRVAPSRETLFKAPDSEAILYDLVAISEREQKFLM